MVFDADFGRTGYTNTKPLEPVLEGVLSDFEWVDEIVMTTPMPLLTGKSARIIITSDTPRKYLESYYGSAMIRQLSAQIFNFVGIDPVEITYFSGASQADKPTADQWIEELARLIAE